mmetsp:Transcript_11260/g.27090  ORF Transcript_11260/g.27090 Transcript_11260/m.27090 type:complete len:113 (+) Transcript_11260:1410-1748(+)
MIASVTSDELKSEEGDLLNDFTASTMDPPRGMFATIEIGLDIRNCLVLYSWTGLTFRGWKCLTSVLIAIPLPIPKAATGAQVMRTTKKWISLVMVKINFTYYHSCEYRPLQN